MMVKKLIRVKSTLVSLLVFMMIFGIATLVRGSEVTTDSILPFKDKLYGDEAIASLWGILKHRVAQEPFNLVATIIFLCAIVHTFLASKIGSLAKHYQKIHEKSVLTDKFGSSVSYKAEILHLFGEIEIIFALWLVPLIIAITYFFGWKEVAGYLNQVNYVEATFVVVIMSIAATKPIIMLAEGSLKNIARIGNCSPAAWWFSILTIGPLLGSLITEPAAMTISAMLLAQQFYQLKPSLRLAYATLGLLFVNVSIGGTLTHFAAPPVLMVASTWGWDISFMLANFGWKVIIAVLCSNLLYYTFFKNDFKRLKEVASLRNENKHEHEVASDKKERPIPVAITLLHILFLAWTVVNLHSIPLVIGGFMLFLACTQVTTQHQYQFAIRAPLLVGLFLAGLVTHGTLQQWWIEPLLGRLNEIPLFIGAVILTAFNDNAAITFLASLVPSFGANIALQKAVVYGAVAGGGLTVIANAPNPAGQSILSHFFGNGVSPLRLFLGALIPTIIVSLAFMMLG